MKVKSTMSQGSRYPYGINTYESVSQQLSKGLIKSPDYTMSQLKKAKKYESITDAQRENIFKRKERSLALTNQWLSMDQRIQHKNEYEQILNLLNNTKLKDLTHEGMAGKQKHVESLFKETLR